MKFTAKNTAIAVLILIAIGFSAYYFISRVPFDQQKPAIGDSAPAIALSDVAGNMVSLSALRGKVVLVNFWAGWCPPCKTEMPGFQKVFMELEDKGFAVLAVSLDDVSLSLVRELGVSFPVMRINDRVKQAYGGVSDVPQSFLIDREGKIIKKVWKVYSENDLRADVEKALGLRR